MSKTKTLTACAMLTAVAVVLARLISFVPSQTARFSIEAVPIFLAGMLFGPMAGALVGFVSDLIGSLLQFGFNPIFCVPPILYGLCAGLFRPMLRKNCSIFTIALAFLPSILFGAILYQSATLAYVYGEGAFWENYLLQLSMRSIRFAITFVIDVLIVYLLYRGGALKGFAEGRNKR